MKRIAIYSRKSRESDTGDSIEVQVKLCKSYCEQHFIGEEIEFYVYQDEGFSGKNTDRPQFQNLINDIKANKINKLISYRLDRISRSVADFSSTLEFLQLHNCDFISIKEQFDTTSPMGRAMIYIASVFAQLERETIAERVKDNMRQLAKQGIWQGGSLPLGFDFERVKYFDESMKERTMCIVKPISEELEYVKHIYSVYLAERSATKAVEILLKEGIKGKKGKTLQSMSVIRLLRNPIYVKSSNDVHEYLRTKCKNVYGEPNGNGYLTYGKTKSDAKRTRNDESKWIYAVSKHEGIIDSDTWLKVQHILDKNKDKQFKRTGTGTVNPALLSGVFKCSKCGSNMVVRRNGDIYYYVCSGKVNKIEHKCNCKNVRVDQIDSLVISKLSGYSKSLLIKKLPDVIKELDNETFKDNTTDTLEKNLKEKKEMVNNLVKRVALAPTDDIAEMFMQQIADINKEIKEIEYQIEGITENVNEHKRNSENVMFFIDSLKKFSSNIRAVDDVMQKRVLIQTIVKKVVWDPDKLDANIEFLADITDDCKKK